MELGPILRAMRRNKTRIGLIVFEVALTLAIVVNCITMISDARTKMVRASGFADVLRHELVADPGEVLVEERVVVRLEPLLDLRFFLVGLVPQTDFVGLGREGLFGARRGQETDEGEPRDRAAGDARGAAPHQFRSARV